MNQFKITYSNGEVMTVQFNGTLTDAQAYYLNQSFTLGEDEQGRETIAEAIRVEQLATVESIKKITWKLEGVSRKEIVKYGIGVQQVFATLDIQDRADITNFSVSVKEEQLS